MPRSECLNMPIGGRHGLAVSLRARRPDEMRFRRHLQVGEGAAPFLCHVRMGGRIASEYGITIREPDPAQHLPL